MLIGKSLSTLLTKKNQLKEGKKMKSYFILTMALILRSDLLQVNKISHLKKYWLDFHHWILTVRVNTEFFRALTGAFSTENNFKIDSLLKTHNFRFYPDATNIFNLLLSSLICIDANMKNCKEFLSCLRSEIFNPQISNR